MASVRELEDLIIDAIYQDIVRGKLDQKEQQFEVEFTMGRDLREGQLQQLLVSLQTWYVYQYRSATRLQSMPDPAHSYRSLRTTTILATLDKKIDTVLSEEKATKLTQEEHEKLREQLIAELQAKSKKGRDGKDGDDVMEVDDMGPGGMAAGVGALLGLGAKRAKYVLCLIQLSIRCWC
jgi:COP9 signalosome complex subunit 7